MLLSKTAVYILLIISIIGPDILYAVFYADEVKEYPIEYTGAQKTAEELA